MEGLEVRLRIIHCAIETLFSDILDILFFEALHEVLLENYDVVLKNVDNLDFIEKILNAVRLGEL